MYNHKTWKTYVGVCVCVLEAFVMFLDQIELNLSTLSSRRYSDTNVFLGVCMSAQAAMINGSGSPYACEATWRPSSLGFKKKRRMFYSLVYAS